MNAAFRKEAVLTIALEGRIDTTNANGIRDEIFGLLETAQPSAIVFDASSLNYISSAGLRIIIGLLKRLNGKVSLIDASPEVYEVLEVTGLTQMMDEPKRLPELGRIMGELMREMHHTKVDSSEMPRARDKANDWVSYIADNFLEADDATLMRSVWRAFPRLTRSCTWTSMRATL